MIALLLPGLWLGGLITSSFCLARFVDRKIETGEIKVPDRG